MLIGNGRLITRDNENTFIENGAVYIEGAKILETGQTKALKAKYPDAEFIDAGGRVIMPGLINTHHHIYSAFARGLNLGNSPKSFQEILETMWWRIDKALSLDDVKYSAYATLIDCIKNGVTTVFDHHASPFAIDGSLFTIGDVSEALGIRGCYCYEVSDRDGEEITDQGITENTAFIKYAKDKGDMLAGMFGLHASFTLSNKTLEKSVAQKPDYAGFHIHAAEGPEDVSFNQENFGKRVITRLNDCGILGEKSIAVHCIHVDETEIDLLKSTDTMVVHNPESNMGNAVGVSPVLKFVQKGILTGLGTDGYTSDMCESLKVANILQKHNEKNPSVAWGEIPQMLFDNNRRIAAKYFDTPVGQLTQGSAADVVIMDYDPLTPMNGDNANMHILFGMTGRQADTVIINGKVVMKDRVIQTADEKEIMAKCRETAVKLWARV